MVKNTLLFNPTNLVHNRNVDIFRRHLPGYSIRCIYNPRQPWFAGMRKIDDGRSFCFNGGHFPSPPAEALNDVDALILFTAQSRIPPASLIQEAIIRSIPIIAIEEVYMMMLEQGFVNNYLLPVDHLFVASEYERERFLEIGMPAEVVEATGYIFRQTEPEPRGPDEKGKLRGEMGLSPTKLTATLSLAFLAASNETLDVRRQLLETVSKGLPDTYELLIKPHPAEQDKDFSEFVARYAPKAKITPPTMAIDKVLDVTSVLFNRGNSQVTIDALQRHIPVIPVPVGRRTFFHGMLRELIVTKESDVGRVLGLVSGRGIDIYKEVFDGHLAIGPEDALKNVISRIEDIVSARGLREPGEKLLELALFWAWMGYPHQAEKTLKLLKGASSDAGLTNAVYRLVSGKADRNDIVLLRRQNKKRYMEWVVQSLWVKILYDRDMQLTPEESEWLSGFPPEMNREKFLPYAALLSWCKVKNGKRADYLRERFKNNLLMTAKNLLWRLGTLQKGG